MPVEFVGRANPDWAVDPFAELENTRTGDRLATSIVITLTRFGGQSAPPRLAATFQTDQGPYVCDAPRRAAWGPGDSVDIRLNCSFYVPSDRLTPRVICRSRVANRADDVGGSAENGRKSATRRNHNM